MGDPMSAGDRDTLTDSAELLIEHQINLLNSRGVECLCGWYLESDPTDTYEGQVAERFYRQHLAAVVAARVRAAQAEAWDEGYGVGANKMFPRNPYSEAGDEFQNPED